MAGSGDHELSLTLWGIVLLQNLIIARADDIPHVAERLLAENRCHKQPFCKQSGRPATSCVFINRPLSNSLHGS